MIGGSTVCFTKLFLSTLPWKIYEKTQIRYLILIAILWHEVTCDNMRHTGTKKYGKESNKCKTTKIMRAEILRNSLSIARKTVFSLFILSIVFFGVPVWRVRNRTCSLKRLCPDKNKFRLFSKLL